MLQTGVYNVYAQVGLPFGDGGGGGPNTNYQQRVCSG